MGPGADAELVWCVVSVQEFASAQGKGVYCGCVEMVQVGPVSVQTRDLCLTHGSKASAILWGDTRSLGIMAPNQ